MEEPEPSQPTDSRPIQTMDFSILHLVEVIDPIKESTGINPAKALTAHSVQIPFEWSFPRKSSSLASLNHSLTRENMTRDYSWLNSQLTFVYLSRSRGDAR